MSRLARRAQEFRDGDSPANGKQHDDAGGNRCFLHDGPATFHHALPFDRLPALQQGQVRRHFLRGLVTLARVVGAGFQDDRIEFEQGMPITVRGPHP